MRFRIVAFAGLISDLIVSAAAQQQTPAGQRGQGGRDLRFESEPVAGTSADSVKIPRGYAVVIGVAKYQHLTDAQQLMFAERDAEAIYSVLISPEGTSE